MKANEVMRMGRKRIAAAVVIAVVAWAAQMERQALGERISAARARVEAKGGRWGRPSRVSDDHVRTMRARYEKGATIRGLQALPVKLLA
jgi:DNA invertase Pin-like site-specific DNA recombinase